MRKGFHVAMIGQDGAIGRPVNLKSPAEVVRWLAPARPLVIGIDSPCRAAEPGERSRSCERELSGSVCAIRYTPGESVIFAGGSYYEWIRNGLELYAALAGDARTARAEVVEVFPTAAWTRWHGARGSRTRARWSSQALALLKLEGLPARRLSQDERDAVVAALTARLFGEGRVEAFGEIIVPAGRPS
jgi:predicted nuclease with RNAse H fold